MYSFKGALKTLVNESIVKRAVVNIYATCRFNTETILSCDWLLILEFNY